MDMDHELHQAVRVDNDSQGSKHMKPHDLVAPGEGGRLALAAAIMLKLLHLESENSLTMAHYFKLA